MTTLNIIRTRETSIEETTHEWNKGAESYNDKGAKGFLGMYKEPGNRPAFFTEYAATETGMFTLEQATEIASQCPGTEFEAVVFRKPFSLDAPVVTYNVVRSATYNPEAEVMEQFTVNCNVQDWHSLQVCSNWNERANSIHLMEKLFGANLEFDNSFVPVKQGNAFVFAAKDEDGEYRVVITRGEEYRIGTGCSIAIYPAQPEVEKQPETETQDCTKVLWLSRHGITPTQQVELIEAFGPVEIVNHTEQVKTASEVVELAKDCAHIMAVLPPHLLAELVNLLRNTGKKVFRAKMRRQEVGTKINPATGVEETDFAMFHDYFEVVEKIEVITSKLV